MKFIEHTISWTKGEIFEASVMTIVGILLLISSIIAYKLGKQNTTSHFFIPLLFVALIFIGAGINGVVSNKKRNETYTEAFKDNSKKIALQEKQRVENFQALYTYTKTGAAIIFILTILVFFFSKNSIIHGATLNLCILGVAGLIIDYFSKARADIYYQAILAYLN